MISTRLAIGIDVGGTNIKGGLINENGKIIYHTMIPTQSKEGYSKVKNNIINLINNIINKNSKLLNEIIGIGIGCAGLIDIKKGLVIESPNLPGFKSVPLMKDIADFFKLPVCLDNDANIVAWGEYCSGAGKNSESMICLTVGTGIGGGIILNNSIWRGFSSSAGEVGHMIIEKNGRKCSCGSYGCLEQYSSATAMVNDAYIALKKGIKSILKIENLNAYNIFIAARNKDKLANQVLVNTANNLSIGIISLVNIINPSVIVIAGGVSKAGKIFIDPIKNNVKKYAFTSATNKLKIVKSSLGDRAGIVGAGYLILGK